MFWRGKTKQAQRKSYFVFRPKADITAAEIAAILQATILREVAISEQSRDYAGTLMRHFEPRE